MIDSKQRGDGVTDGANAPPRGDRSRLDVYALALTLGARVGDAHGGLGGDAGGAHTGEGLGAEFRRAGTDGVGKRAKGCEGGHAGRAYGHHGGGGGAPPRERGVVPRDLRRGGAQL
jgi:hypothetical protein